MINKISNPGLKRKFEEVDKNAYSGSNKIRRIEGDTSVHTVKATAESVQLVFYNSYECIASYLSIDALINFSKTDKWAYTKLSDQIKALGRDRDIQEIWGPIEYLTRFAIGSINVLHISPYLQQMASYNEVQPPRYDESVSFYEKMKLLVAKQGGELTIQQDVSSSLQAQKVDLDSTAKLPFNAIVFLRFLGVNPSVSNSYYRTPIMNAFVTDALKGTVDKIKFLIAGIDNEVATADLFDELASVSFLSAYEKIEKMQFLLDEGVNPNITSSLQHTSVLQKVEVVEFLISKGLNSNDPESFFELSLLHKAIQHAEIDVVRVVYSHSLKRNIRDRFGNTPLHYLAMRSGLNNHSNKLGTLKFILKEGEDPNMENRLHRTPLHIAVENDPQQDIIQCLLESGADPKLQDARGQTALDLYRGRVKGWDAIMQLLTDYGAPISWWDRMHRRIPFLN
ncbi:MAG: hypothetical protein S4CHLAM123_05600 [Chlamydiales bacterium]|nr:hypothetical protein [Chlamydiales bacterium]